MSRGYAFTCDWEECDSQVLVESNGIFTQVPSKWFEVRIGGTCYHKRDYNFCSVACLLSWSFNTADKEVETADDCEEDHVKDFDAD